MGIVVRLPSILKKLVGNNGVAQVSGGTITEAIKDLVRQFPELRERLFASDGKINPFLIVCLNGEDIRFKERVLTPVADGDEISIIPAISGG